MPGPFTTEWFYNDVSGSVISEPAVVGFSQGHFPGWHGPFASKQAALDFYTANKAAHPGWKAPTGLDGAVGNTVTSGAAAAAGGVADFLTRLVNPHTWLRVGEFVVGAIFLVIGLNALLHNPAGKVAGVAAKVARLWPHRPASCSPRALSRSETSGCTTPGIPTGRFPLPRWPYR